MDVINLISKDQNFPDAEPVLGRDAKYHPGGKYYFNGPRMHEYLEEVKSEVLSKYDNVTVGEMPGISDIEEILRIVRSGTGELSMIFIFDVVDIDNEPGKTRFTLYPWTVQKLGDYITKWQKALIDNDGWNSVFIENHDNPRSVSRYTDDADQHRVHGAKLLTLMQTTLGGTLFVYQGEELGMKNMPTDWAIEPHYKDIETINFWKKSNDLYGGGKDPQRLSQARHILVAKARDHARTPMQWDNTSPNAGFCAPNVTPWMRVVDDYPTVNAHAQITADTDAELSVWRFWQRCIQTRKTHADVFVHGGFERVAGRPETVFAYKRTSSAHVDKEKWLVVLNFSGEKAGWDVPTDVKVEAWVVGNYGQGEVEKEGEGRIELAPWEGVVGRLV